MFMGGNLLKKLTVYKMKTVSDQVFTILVTWAVELLIILAENNLNNWIGDWGIQVIISFTNTFVQLHNFFRSK